MLLPTLRRASKSLRARALFAGCALTTTLALTGCPDRVFNVDDAGSAVDGGDGGELVDPTKTTADDTDAALADAIEARVTGSFVLRYQVAATRSVPLFGDTGMRTTTTSLADIERVGNRFVMHERLCRVGLAFDSTHIGMSVDDAVPQIVPVQSTAIRFTGTAAAPVFARAASVLVVGATLVDPANDKLPTRDSDPRVRDTDGDGKAGITVHVTGNLAGDAYVAQRNRPQLDGTVDADGVLTGIVTDIIEQAILGASNPLLLVPLGSVPNTDPTKNPMTVTPYTGDATCEALLASVAD